ncbi:hypothetical protein JM946_14225 [Steroidobacter sp. S1-65]|uniref:ATP-binding protein n=1 Tax=Steroidobacter gossypii TaxID=2805490 RepID=A0ABS1WY32_9GAMM|nr:hypothetical protein [Steroidobacter gossypii]MBM0105884.1 hypothetical protein [Steroidobacter gossypii]
MSSVEPEAFFDQFNAKYLEPEQVAAGYVYSKHLEDLCGHYNAVLIGPRGSGKTTLLKMLQPAALDAWKGPRADKFRSRINYSGVFIASDISWSRQLRALGYGKLNEDNHRTLVLACFTTHVLHAVLETMVSRTSQSASFKAVRISGPEEEVLAKQLLSELQLAAPLPTLIAVKQALRSRLSTIRQLGNRGSLKNQVDFQSELADLRFLHLDFLDLCSNISSLFNDAVGEKDARWALLFDELETAPDWIVDQLFTALRVSNPRVYLKLAISPVSATAYRSLMSVDGAADRHDYKNIPLWYTDKVDAKGFCEDVWRSLTSKAGLSVSAREALGPSAFEPVSPEQVRLRNPYAAGGYWHRIFQSLRSKDRTFAAFLRARNIDLDRLANADQQTKDAVLRRAAPIAAVRNFYLHEDRLGNVTARQRKTTALYAGAESIFAVSEGNPRWLIGLLTPMISFMVENRTKRVPPAVQAEQIDNAADRLLALLRTIPVPSEFETDSALGLNRIVGMIGVQLHNDLMDKNFSLDPRLSFVVDKAVKSSTVQLLSSGINRGAVILVAGTPAQSVVGDMQGVVLRLSYLLAAKYGLPLRKGKATNLSLLVEGPPPPAPPPPPEPQLKLSGL